MGLLSDMLKDNEATVEARAAKPLIDATADQRRMEGIAAMIPVVTDAFSSIGITEWPKITTGSGQKSFEEQAKGRAEALGAMVGSVAKGVADVR